MEKNNLNQIILKGNIHEIKQEISLVDSRKDIEVITVYLTSKNKREENKNEITKEDIINLLYNLSIDNKDKIFIKNSYNILHQRAMLGVILSSQINEIRYIIDISDDLGIVNRLYNLLKEISKIDINKDDMEEIIRIINRINYIINNH